MSRGELRIYMGAAPGVGKTFAMLNEGRRRRERGTDVVIGYVETHNRPQTVAQIADLEVVSRRSMVHRGQTFEEMDLDAVLARHPDIALVDELAHTNVPGSRNEKRWQDVEELLAAGISVISTVNVQHLESLNDVIAQITGVVQKETIPDVVARRAEQVELLDMTPEALQRRMAHGNIYAAEKVDTALANYFRAGNLGALRELALLWVADRVDEGIETYRQRHGITAPWETHERIVVALTGAPNGDLLLRRGSRLAARAGGELVGVHIRATDGLATQDQSKLEAHRELLEELGGRYAEATGDDIAQALVEFTRAENGTQILLGASRRSRWAELTKGSIINRVVNLVEGIDVHIIAPQRRTDTRSSLAGNSSPGNSSGQISTKQDTSGRDPSENGHPNHCATTSEGSHQGDRQRRTKRQPNRHSARSRLFAWIVAVIVTPLLGIGLVPSENHLGITTTLLVLLLGPIVAALLGGIGPALVASVMAFLALDVFYIRPSFSLRIANPSDLGTLVVFVAVAGLVSYLVDRLANRTAEVTRERTEADALARLANSTAVLDAGALDRLVGELRVTLGLDAVAVLSPSELSSSDRDTAGNGATDDGSSASHSDRVSEWEITASSGEPVPTSPDEGTYSAELASGATLVTVGPTMAAADRRLLIAFVAQVQLAQATLKLQGEATRAEALAESNDLRRALLAAVSHDLRAPLANIKAAATSLTNTEIHWSDEERLIFAETIDKEADRLTTLVVNLLDMSRLQVGMLGVELWPTPVDEVIYESIAAISGDVSVVDVDLPEGLAKVRSDKSLLERVLVNVIRNAIDWTPDGSGVRVEADQVEAGEADGAQTGDRVEIRVIDVGKGISADDRAGVFEPFQRLGDGGNANIQGIGLGLAVSRGFCDAIGATISIEDTPGGGTTVVIGVPIADVPRG